MTGCARCDDLLDELARTREELAAVREDVSERTWERDHAVANHRRVQGELLALQARFYAPRRPESAQ